MTEMQLDIGNEFSRSWKLFNPNMSVLIVAALIGIFLSLVTCGVLCGSMTAGLLLIVRKLQRNDPVKPQAGDILQGFDYFRQTLVVFLVFILASYVVSLFIGWVPVLGRLFSFLFSLFSGAVVMWSMTFVVYEKMTAVDAFKRLTQGVISGSLVTPLVFGLLVSLLMMSGLHVRLLNSAGGLIFGICAIFTYPLGCCCMASAYETLFGGAAEIGCETIPPFDSQR